MIGESVLLEDLLDGDLLADMIVSGYVASQSHPTLPLVIYNYTKSAQWDGVWNDVTKKCRGLIVNTQTREVVARPFEKFFNLSQHDDTDIPTDQSFQVFEKMDGSLGILYVTPDGYRAIATRGSFTSDQAIHATAVYIARYAQDHEVRVGDTWLFEIVYPENRIVVDYGATDDLVLLDVIDNLSGSSVLHLSGHRWPGPRARRYDGFDSLEKLLAGKQESNFEGYVLRFDNGFRVKVKHDEYIRLHRIMTNISAKAIWEMVSTAALKAEGVSAKHITSRLQIDHREVERIFNLDGDPIDDVIDRVPDEFYEWVRATVDDLRLRYYEIYQNAAATYEMILQGLQEAGDAAAVGAKAFRYRFYQAAQLTEYSDIVLAMFDEHSFSAYIWKRIKPEWSRPYFSVSEAVA